ncbi:MAG: NAD(P)/FAD-dependent oxidoreductase [Williamsia sp.]|nr:NAD(P)/FAD-dependent oxidoreductase [Williamsia sp.]
MVDVAIIGGGLAGLALSIQLARLGWSVVLVEKESYPFHKVCGEYISMESWDFLEGLGYPLRNMDLPRIKNLIVSAPNGKMIQHPLPLGGFGISRYKIDSELARLAVENGVQLKQGTTVRDVVYGKNVSTVVCSGVRYQAKLVCGSFGKKSNLDIKWKRPFAEQRPSKLNNWIGVKYHVRTNFLPDTIALHNFENGYCGISRIEEGKYCLCYLTTAANLLKSGHSISRMEEIFLHRNPHLKKIFGSAEFLYRSPLTISQISFQQKSQVERGVLLLGDAAGLITPLCGNGMSMGLHASKLATPLIHQFLQKGITREQLEQAYIQEWTNRFSRRLQAGRLIQRLFGKTWMTDAFIRAAKPFPAFISYLIKQTHGEPF